MEVNPTLTFIGYAQPTKVKKKIILSAREVDVS
jgi:hypothetical protein